MASFPLSHENFEVFLQQNKEADMEEVAEANRYEDLFGPLYGNSGLLGVI